MAVSLRFVHFVRGANGVNLGFELASDGTRYVTEWWSDGVMVMLGWWEGDG